ncbi:MAG TPA: hypothetical protein VGA89_00100 [Patescibacteria group bacterium]|jgi:hypothetical protein
MKKMDPDLANVQTEAKATERSLKLKKRQRSAKKKDGSPSLNERLVAPLLLIITMLISYVIFLFS